jgi:sulfite reductase beta subunit-like hemoprotein
MIRLLSDDYTVRMSIKCHQSRDTRKKRRVESSIDNSSVANFRHELAQPNNSSPLGHPVNLASQTAQLKNRVQYGASKRKKDHFHRKVLRITNQYFKLTLIYFIAL